jgi:DNA-binding CsgD family transcriptional regulator/tetratricopeptide (TPR) repeat protein
MLGSMAARVSSPVFVGRRAELDAMALALDRAASGETVHVLVTGEAGVGKTRLTVEVARIASERGIRVLRGECVNVGGSSLPYGPFVEALRGLISELDEAEVGAIAGPAAADLARLVPGFGPVGVAAPQQTEWAESRLLEAFLGFLSRLAERSPVLLIVEDLHWADPATRELLGFLVQARRNIPILVVGTLRSDELHRRHPLRPWLAELERGGRVERVELARLDRPRLAALVTAILGKPPGRDVIDDILARSDGNPFFAEELLAASQDGTGRRLPPTLREILLARIAMIPETAAAVLDVAAVAGRRVEHDLLAEVSGLQDDVLFEGLRAAVGGYLLVVESDGSVERYAFRHALVQEVVYDELLPGERVSLHRAFAEALDRQVPGQGAAEAGHWAELAHHWAAARDDGRAFAASLRAAEAAVASSAFGAALQDYERALELWDGLADAAQVAGFDRVDLLRRAGMAAYLAANYRRAVALRREAVARADVSTDPIRAGILREELGRALWLIGDSTASLDAYREAVGTVPAAPATAERARAVSGLGQILMLSDRYAESAALCEEAIAIARAVGARAQEGHALSTLGRDITLLGRCAEGMVPMLEALRIAREVGSADDIGRAFVNLAEAHDDCGDLEEASARTAEGIREAEDLGIAHSYGHYIRLGGVSLAYNMGRWDEAQRLLDEAMSRAPTGSGAEIYRLASSLSFQVGQGRFAVAETGIARARELLEKSPGAQFIGPVSAASAELELWRHAPLAALARIEEALELLLPTDDRLETGRLCRIGGWAAGDLADAGRAVRDTAMVASAANELTRLRARLDRARDSLPVDGLDRELGAIGSTLDAEATRVDGAADPAAWHRVADRWAELQRPYVCAYARWREAEAAASAGDRVVVANALRDAFSIASRLDAAPLREAVEALGRRARIDLATPEPSQVEPEPASEMDRFGLTPRELEVLVLVADGRTNRQIADHLFISGSTAGVHVSNIIGKLGVTSRVEAAAIAFRLGMVSADAPPDMIRGGSRSDG